jgi:histidyl-tRNA synthetase
MKGSEAMVRVWRLRFDGTPPGPNARMHHHQRARITARWKANAAVLVRAAEIPRLGRIRLSAIFYRKVVGTADPDNDLARCKVLADAVVAMGVVPTDTYRYVEWGAVCEQRGPAGVELIIEEVDSVQHRD